MYVLVMVALVLSSIAVGATAGNFFTIARQERQRRADIKRLLGLFKSACQIAHDSDMQIIEQQQQQQKLMNALTMAQAFKPKTPPTKPN